MRLIITVLTAVWTLSLMRAPSAQPFPGGLDRAARQAADIDLPQEPSYLGAFSAPKLALYKPEGHGPFPAIVLLHQCGGLRSSSGAWQNMSVLGWAKEAVSRGYVAMVLDSLGPRGADSVCYGVKGGVNFPRGVRDAFQAQQHLQKLPFVDSRRIAFVGFSWGAMVGVMATSKTWAQALSDGGRFRSVVAFYPACFEVRPASGVPYAVINQDIDTPLLVLMGALDTETPPDDCTSRLEAVRKMNAPVDWTVYPEATHCWDCQNLNGLRKTDFRGTAVEYKYNSDVMKQSVERTFSFLRKTLE